MARFAASSSRATSGDVTPRARLFDLNDTRYRWSLFNMNNKKQTLATYIDFSKAFDMLDHDILIDRLTRLKISTVSISWFTSYLKGRTQQTIANGVMSNKAPIRTRVPQGPILGPLLFIIHANRITATTRSSQVIMYADDTMVYTPVDRYPFDEQINNYQADIDRLHNWCCTSWLSINSQKTKLMVLVLVYPR